MRYIGLIWNSTMEIIGTSLKRFIFLIGLSVISLMVLVIAIYLHDKYWEFEWSAKRSLTNKPERIGIINILADGDSEEVIGGFIREYPNVIKGIGENLYQEADNENPYNAISEVEELTYKYCGVERGTILPYYSFSSAYTEGLFELPLQKGELVTPGSELHKNYDTVIYLGSDYANVPVGTEWNMDKKGEHKAIVAGILEKGVTLPDYGEIVDREGSVRAVAVCMDDKYLDISTLENYGILNVMVTWDPEISYYEFKGMMMDYCQKNGYNIDIGLLSHKFEEYNDINKYRTDTLRRLVIIVILIVVTMLISVQVVAIIKNKHIYSIYTVSGMIGRDICLITFLENVIRYVISVLLVSGLVFLYIKGIPTVFAGSVIRIFYSYVWYKVIIIYSGVMIVATIVPLIIMSKMTPVKLMEE